MTAIARSAAFLRALRILLPNAILSVTQERPWFSLTFAGTQLCLSVTIAGDAHREVAAEYARILPENDFDLGAQLVADIAVSTVATGDNESSLTIYALLLDD